MELVSCFLFSSSAIVLSAVVIRCCASARCSSVVFLGFHVSGMLSPSVLGMTCICSCASFCPAGFPFCMSMFTPCNFFSWNIFSV